MIAFTCIKKLNMIITYQATTGVGGSLRETVVADQIYLDVFSPHSILLNGAFFCNILFTSLLLLLFLLPTSLL